MDDTEENGYGIKKTSESNSNEGMAEF